MVWGNGIWRLWSIHDNLCCSFLLTLFLYSILRCPTQGLWSFTNSSSMDPFCRLQSSRDGLLQHTSPLRSYDLQENLHKLQFPIRHICLLWHGCPPWIAGVQLPHHGLHHSCKGICALVCGSPPLSPSALIWQSAELFLPHVVSPVSWLLLHSSFYSFSVLLQRCYCHY